MKTPIRSLTNPRDKSALVLRLHTIRHDSPRQWGRMSSHQMICHLSDAFRVALGEKHACFTPHLINQTLIKWIALRSPLQWPKGFQTPPEVNQDGEACTRPMDFEQDLTQLFALIERFTSTQENSFRFQPHPIFGRLSEWEWFRWGFLHIDHHLRQFGA
jgi:Protein of unknown function (DUF1569)